MGHGRRKGGLKCRPKTTIFLAGLRFFISLTEAVAQGTPRLPPPCLPFSATDQTPSPAPIRESIRKQFEGRRFLVSYISPARPPASRLDTCRMARTAWPPKNKKGMPSRATARALEPSTARPVRPCLVVYFLQSPVIGSIACSDQRLNCPMRGSIERSTAEFLSARLPMEPRTEQFSR